MLKVVDRGVTLMFALMSAGHAFIGTLMARPFFESYTMWAVSGSVAAWMIAVLNWLRTGRPNDRALACWALVGAISWIGLQIWLMEAAQMWADPRPWLFILVCVILAGFSIATIANANPPSQTHPIARADQV